MHLVAFTIKGLEEIVAEEITSVLPNIGELEKFTKIVKFSYSGDPRLFTKLTTADDLGLLLQEFEITQGEVPQITLPYFDETLKYIESFRKLGKTYSITSSIVSREINKDSVSECLKEYLNKLGYAYSQTDRSNMDFRIYINDTHGIISLRLTSDPLSKRDYDSANYLGALKSSIAASMVFVATKGLNKDIKIVDNFCGSGTILCEAFLKNYKVYGGDINNQGVSLAMKNLRSLGSTQTNNIQLQDALKSKWPDSYFDCAISNIPWDKQHEIANITSFYSDVITEYARILKANYRLCIICHNPNLLVKHIKKAFVSPYIHLYPLGYLGQTPTIVVASSTAL